MPKILIVGAGQSGLQLALCLQAHGGYDVTVMSARTPAEIWHGAPTSTQCMFGPALEIERAHGLNLWEDRCPRLTAQRGNVAAPPADGPDADGWQRALAFTGRWKHPDEPERPWYTQSVDQRIKMGGWLELFENRGGTVIYQGVMTSDLDGLAALGRYDLVIVSAGKGELTALFDRDPDRSPFDRPQRCLSALYTRGMSWAPEYQDYAVSLTAIPGIGELIRMPALTVDGDSGMQPCDIMLVEGIPDGPLGFGAWSDRPDPAEHLERLRNLLHRYAPWEADCMTADFDVTDARPSLIGAYAPTVRRPVAQLPSGGIVLGMADVVVANDPVTGQGSNNACHCAEIYYQSIIEHGDRPYTADWMRDTFERYWAYAGRVTELTNFMLRPPPEHLLRIFAAADRGDTDGNPVVAERFAYGYTTPADMDWVLYPDAADEYLRSVAPEFATPAGAAPAG